ncbi:MAG TPA: hypothetical protein VKR38_09530 [Usitatibacter sp.]|nr:hypothetical protein [Usitatibacter sp.]
MVRRLLALGILAASLDLAAAGIYKCTSPSGSVSYQEIACAGTQTGGVANIPTGFPDMNVIEHDHILQLGSMAEARLLKRYEIDSNERVAMADIAARERAAQMAAANVSNGDASLGYGLGWGGRLIPIAAHRSPPPQHNGHSALLH